MNQNGRVRGQAPAKRRRTGRNQPNPATFYHNPQPNPAPFQHNQQPSRFKSPQEIQLSLENSQICWTPTFHTSHSNNPTIKPFNSKELKRMIWAITPTHITINLFLTLRMHKLIYY